MRSNAAMSKAEKLVKNLGFGILKTKKIS